MRRTSALDGPDWELQGYLGLDAALAAAAREPGHDDRDRLPARVPGSVLDDLWRAGEVPKPYVERNSLAREWLPERAWVLPGSIAVPALADGERRFLRLDGIDHAGQVVLDGAPVARHEGMFLPLEVDVTDRVGRGGGSHRLAVVLGPAPG